MTYWSDGSRLTTDDLNMIVGRIEALEAAIRNPDFLQIFIQGFEAGKAAK